MERSRGRVDASRGMLKAIAVESRDTRAVELLLAHCAAVSAARESELRRPVFDRLRDLLGADLTRLLLFGLAGAHRARSRQLPL